MSFIDVDSLFESPPPVQRQASLSGLSSCSGLASVRQLARAAQAAITPQISQDNQGEGQGESPDREDPEFLKTTRVPNYLKSMGHTSTRRFQGVGADLVYSVLAQCRKDGMMGWSLSQLQSHSYPFPVSAFVVKDKRGELTKEGHAAMSRLLIELPRHAKWRTIKERWPVLAAIEGETQTARQPAVSFLMDTARQWFKNHKNDAEFQKADQVKAQKAGGKV